MKTIDFNEKESTFIDQADTQVDASVIYEKSKNDFVRDIDSKESEPEVIINDDKNQNLDNLSEDDFRSLIDQEFSRQSKKILATKLSEDIKKRLDQAVAILEELHANVLQKNKQALEKNNEIKNMVVELVKSGHIQVNEQEFKRSEESVLEYVGLLDDVKQEIESELSRALIMKNIKEGEECTVWKNSPDNYESFVEDRIKSLKRYARSVQRDLAISYSRYCFGFDSQMKQIDSIRRFVSSRY